MSFRYFIRTRTVVSLFLLTLVSCSQDNVVDEFVQIPQHQWSYDFQPEIQINVTDKNQKYKVFLNLKHSRNYPFSNFYFLLHAPGSTESLGERFEVTLAEADGKWTGKGNGGQYSHQLLIKDQYIFPDTGLMTFRLEQNMRTNPLVGLVACGLRIEPIR